MCYDGYMALLRPTGVLWCSAKDTKSVAGSEDNLRCCSGYRRWLTTTEMALVTTRQR